MLSYSRRTIAVSGMLCLWHVRIVAIPIHRQPWWWLLSLRGSCILLIPVAILLRRLRSVRSSCMRVRLPRLPIVPLRAGTATWSAGSRRYPICDSRIARRWWHVCSCLLLLLNRQATRCALQTFRDASIDCPSRRSLRLWRQQLRCSKRVFVDSWWFGRQYRRCTSLLLLLLSLKMLKLRIRRQQPWRFRLKRWRHARLLAGSNLSIGAEASCGRSQRFDKKERDQELLDLRLFGRGSSNTCIA